MADEITVTVGLRCVNGLLSVTPPTATTRFDQTTAGGGGPGTVTIGTTQEAIAFGDIAPGFIRMTNLDATNFVDYGTVTGDLGFQLIAGGGLGLVYLKSGDTLYMKADTASCNVLIEALTI